MHAISTRWIGGVAACPTVSKKGPRNRKTRIKNCLGGVGAGRLVPGLQTAPDQVTVLQLKYSITENMKILECMR